MIFTLYGVFIRHFGGEIGLNSLTHLLGEFDFREPAVRAAVTRLSAQGWLETRRIGRNSYCSLTTKGWQRVDEAASRVYRNRRENWDGKWCILTYTIPEEKREARDQLRTDLVWWGFGQLATSTWISPHKYSRHMVDLVNRYNLSDYVDIFYACYEGAKTNLQLAQKSWNLNEVQQKYNEFVAVFLPAFQADKLNPPSDREAFVKRCRLVHEYRKFLFIDPALPNELLPQDWGGTRAFNLIQQYDRLLAPGAGRYFVKLFAAAPDSTPQDIEQGLEAQLNPFGLGD
jgi:phenylacetic acid degradation operon negative regulatory protein